MSALSFGVPLLCVAVIVLALSFLLHTYASTPLDAIAQFFLSFDEFVPARLAALRWTWSLAMIQSMRAIRAAGTQEVRKRGGVEGHARVVPTCAFDETEVTLG